MEIDLVSKRGILAFVLFRIFEPMNGPSYAVRVQRSVAVCYIGVKEMTIFQ